jgi:hypothetical protein
MLGPAIAFIVCYLLSKNLMLALTAGVATYVILARRR